MNQTQQTTRPSRFRSLAEDLFGPVESTPSPVRRRLLLGRSALAYFTLIATLVQVVVWLMIAVITADLDSPWWLWTTLPAASGVGLLTLADHWHGWYAAATRTNSTQEVTR